MTNYIIANNHGEVLETREASKKATVEKYAKEKYSEMETWIGTEKQFEKAEFEVVEETTVEETPSETIPESVEVEEVTALAVVEQAVVVEEKKVVANKDKKPQFLNIEQVTKLYGDYGIKCHNPNAKGNYRIMGSAKGSSLNIKSTKGYYIYSTDTDLELIKNANLEYEDLIVEAGTNSTDRTRPNTIICKTVETLKALLQIYATNPFNKVALPTA